MDRDQDKIESRKDIISIYKNYRGLQGNALFKSGNLNLLNNL